MEYQTGGPIPGAASWLGNLSVFYRPTAEVLLTARWNYVGDRARGADDPRDDLAGYSNVSLTLNWFDVGFPGVDLRAGLTNVLGEAIVGPAPALTYRDDYPTQTERAAWLQLSYELP